MSHPDRAQPAREARQVRAAEQERRTAEWLRPRGLYVHALGSAVPKWMRLALLPFGTSWLRYLPDLAVVAQDARYLERRSLRMLEVKEAVPGRAFVACASAEARSQLDQWAATDIPVTLILYPIMRTLDLRTAWSRRVSGCCAIHAADRATTDETMPCGNHGGSLQPFVRVPLAAFTPAEEFVSDLLVRAS